MNLGPVPHPLRAWREHEGKSQGWCAQKLGCTRQAWADWERGQRIPSKTYMLKIIGLTGGLITADEFYQQLSEAA